MQTTTDKMRVVRSAVVALLVAAGVFFSTTPARAFQLDMTCNQFVDALALEPGEDELAYTAVGVTVGAVGELANLLCFVGDRRCSCLRNATDNDRPALERWLDDLFDVVDTCYGRPSGNRNLSGMSQQAALVTCP
jgi:hypothetical protein